MSHFWQLHCELSGKKIHSYFIQIIKGFAWNVVCCMSGSTWFQFYKLDVSIWHSEFLCSLSNKLKKIRGNFERISWWKDWKGKKDLILSWPCCCHVWISHAKINKLLFAQGWGMFSFNKGCHQKTNLRFFKEILPTYVFQEFDNISYSFHQRSNGF